MYVSNNLCNSSVNLNAIDAISRVIYANCRPMFGKSSHTSNQLYKEFLRPNMV